MEALSYVQIRAKIKILLIITMLINFVIKRLQKLKQVQKFVALGVQMMLNMERDVVK